ncbi:MAG: rhodanese-like domain-containing protein [Desulfosarcinaceae bacterium]|jgi:rhodanese-related sulfurtransferase
MVALTAQPNKQVHRRARLVVFLVAVGLFFPAVLPAKPSANLTPDAAMRLIAAQQDNPDFVLLDVRTPGEYNKGHIPGAKMLDFYQRDFIERLKALDRDKTYLVYCRSGNRSGRTLALMDKLGFKRVAHLAGGILAWQRKGYALVNANAVDPVQGE